MENAREDIYNSINLNSLENSSKQILVADDNEAILNIVSNFLEFIGFEVSLAADGIEALNTFIDRSFDLVITDINMPIMDGWDLARCIKEKSPKTPVILMTGEDKETVLLEMRKENIDHVIFKPFSLDNLHKTLQKTIA